MDSSKLRTGITELGTYEERSRMSYMSDEYEGMGPVRKTLRLLGNLCYLAFGIVSTVIDVLLLGMVTLFVSFLPISKSSKKTFYRGIKVVSHHMVMSLFEFWLPHAIFVKYSGEVLEHRRNIVISNHCSDYDWIFISCLMVHLKKLASIYIIMKDVLRKIPVVGYVMDSFGYVFLARKKGSAHDGNVADLDILGQLVDSASMLDSYEILLFPEGTYPTSRSVRDAKTHAKERKMMHENKPYVPELALIPRNGGFNMMRNRLTGLEGVVDITVLMNPYIRRPREELSATDIIVYGSQRLSQAFIVSYAPKESIDDEFLHETFCRKDKILQQYVEEMTAGNDGRAPAPIRDIGDFKRILEKIDPVSPKDKVEVIYMHSPYRLPVLMVAPLVVCTLVYAVPRLLGAAWNVMPAARL